MFDDLREEASRPFYEEEAKFEPALSATQDEPVSSSRFLGMTPIQRFVIAVMLMSAVCVIGAMALLVLGKIGF